MKFPVYINDIIDSNIKKTLAYVDNIIITGNSQEEHDFNLQRFWKLPKGTILLTMRKVS